VEEGPETGVYGACIYNVNAGGGGCTGVDPKTTSFTTSEALAGEVNPGTTLEYWVTACFTDPKKPGGCVDSDRITVNVP
jgi:hypothetical protein